MIKNTHNNSIYDETKNIFNSIEEQIDDIEHIKNYIKVCIDRKIAQREYLHVLRYLEYTKHTLKIEKKWYKKMVDEMEYILNL